MCGFVRELRRGIRRAHKKLKLKNYRLTFVDLGLPHNAVWMVWGFSYPVCVREQSICYMGEIMNKHFAFRTQRHTGCLALLLSTAGAIGLSPPDKSQLWINAVIA